MCDLSLTYRSRTQSHDIYNRTIVETNTYYLFEVKERRVETRKPQEDGKKWLCDACYSPTRAEMRVHMQCETAIVRPRAACAQLSLAATIDKNVICDRYYQENGWCGIFVGRELVS